MVLMRNKLVRKQVSGVNGQFTCLLIINFVCLMRQQTQLSELLFPFDPHCMELMPSLLGKCRMQKDTVARQKALGKLRNGSATMPAKSKSLVLISANHRLRSKLPFKSSIFRKSFELNSLPASHASTKPQSSTNCQIGLQVVCLCSHVASNVSVWRSQISL